MCKLIKKKAKYLRTFKCQYFTMYVDLKVAWIKLNQKAKKINKKRLGSQNNHELENIQEFNLSTK